MNFFYSIITYPTNFVQVLIAVVMALVLGGALSFAYTIVKRDDGYYKDIPITLFIFPVILTILTIAMGVMGYQLGDGSNEVARYARVAVALLAVLLVVKIRSNQRDTEDIVLIFFVTGLGMLCGTGYVFVTLVYFFVIAGVYFLLKFLGYPKMPRERMSLKITVAENLDFENAFDDIFEKYTTHYFLKRVKTTDLGSLLLLSYEIHLKKGVSSKDMLDEVRARNGNLDVAVVYARHLSNIE